MASTAIRIERTIPQPWAEILTPEALGFVGQLTRTFGARRRALLARRVERQRELDRGVLPDLLPETRAIRDADWRVAPIPDDLLDRRVEITGPVDRKMIINALNSGANVFMADFEDSNAPTWANVVEGQIHLRDAVRRSISFTGPEGKKYELGERTATLMVRPRGWHMEETRVTLDGEAVPAALFDFGLYMFHNARELLGRGTGPYFYLPKLESHLEARLWNDVFVAAQDLLGIPQGSIRATVLIETILAAFEMDEILYELREHSAGLNCGRWDYIFSIIKKFREHEAFVLPDRDQVTMTTPGMRSYSLLAIRTCHRRSIHAIGGMAAWIPVKADAAANERALAKVRDDKEREAGDGHDGTWVAHPGLVGIAREAFDAVLRGPHQIHRLREDVSVASRDLLTVPRGTVTERGLRHNLDVGIRYIGSWLAGTGCVPIYNLMEDAATAEISRSQVWQWVRHGARLDDGRTVTAEMVRALVGEELGRIREELGPAFSSTRFAEAAEVIEDLSTRREFAEFLTLAAYPRLA
jgi:malate synthase